jgi:hypothetical protein
MKLLFSLFLSLFTFSSCTSTDPDACTCGKELSKSTLDQDQDVMDACAQKGAAMDDKEKVRWFEDIMTCVD